MDGDSDSDIIVVSLQPSFQLASSQKASSQKASSQKASSQKASSQKASSQKASSQRASSQTASSQTVSSQTVSSTIFQRTLSQTAQLRINSTHTYKYQKRRGSDGDEELQGNRKIRKLTSTVVPQSKLLLAGLPILADFDRNIGRRPRNMWNSDQRKTICVLRRFFL